MDTVWYQGPSRDEFVSDPYAGWMRRTMRRGEEYWSRQATTYASLYCLKDPLPEVPTALSPLHGLPGLTLFIQHLPRRGWYFEYIRKETAESWDQILFTFDPAALRRRVKQPGNENSTTYKLVGCYVSQATAEQVVADFLSTRQPSSATSWAVWGSLDVPVYVDESEYREQRQRLKGQADSGGPSNPAGA